MAIAPVSSPAVFDDLEEQQNELLRRLDELNVRVEQVLREQLLRRGAIAGIKERPRGLAVSGH